MIIICINITRKVAGWGKVNYTSVVFWHVIVQHTHITECQPFAGNKLGKVWKAKQITKNWENMEFVLNGKWGSSSYRVPNTLIPWLQWSVWKLSPATSTSTWKLIWWNALIKMLIYQWNIGWQMNTVKTHVFTHVILMVKI